MVTKRINRAAVTYNDSQAIKDAVFDKVLAWFFEVESFSGEGIMQCDVPQIEAPRLLGNLADDILQFNVVWDGG